MDCNVTEDDVGKIDIPLSKCTDLKKLRMIVEHLYMLLDNVDTADDLAKDNDKMYRNLAFRAQKKKNEYIITDGYGIFVKP